MLYIMTTINSYGISELNKYIIFFDILKVIILLFFSYIWYIYYQIITYRPVPGDQMLYQDIIVLDNNENIPYCYLQLYPCIKKINIFINKSFCLSNYEYTISCHIIFSIILFFTLLLITYIFFDIIYLWVA